VNDAIALLFPASGSGVLALLTVAVPVTTEPSAAEHGSAATIVIVEEAAEAIDP